MGGQTCPARDLFSGQKILSALLNSLIKPYYYFFIDRVTKLYLPTELKNILSIIILCIPGKDVQKSF